MEIYNCLTSEPVTGAFKLYDKGYEISATTMPPKEICVFNNTAGTLVKTFPPGVEGMLEACEFVRDSEPV